MSEIFFQARVPGSFARMVAHIVVITRAAEKKPLGIILPG